MKTPPGGAGKNGSGGTRVAHPPWQEAKYYVSCRFIALSFLGILLASGVGSTVGDANDIVEIRLRGRYYAEPATVQITVAVEPDAVNRALRVEAESERMFRSSEITLAGAGEKRIHTLEFKNLPAGDYVLSAQVFSSNEMRAVATQQLTVSGSGVR
jgi:hypothetical protein